MQAAAYFLYARGVAAIRASSWRCKKYFRILSKFHLTVRYYSNQQSNTPMKNYVLLFRGGMDYSTASPEALQADMQQWRGWMDNLASQGKMLPGGQQLSNNGAVVTGSGKQATDGPFTEGKEIIGGFITISAADLAEAVTLAEGCPIYAHGGATEVREVVAM